MKAAINMLKRIKEYSLSYPELECWLEALDEGIRCLEERDLGNISYKEAMALKTENKRLKELLSELYLMLAAK